MVQFRNRIRLLPESRRWTQRILFSLLLGSLLGALWARMQPGLTALDPEALGRVSPVRGFLRNALFPCLLAAALILRGRFLFCLLFFLKGVGVSFLLCASAAAGDDWLSAVLPTLILDTLLPLPLLLRMGAVWGEQAETGEASLWLLFPALLVGFLSALLRAALF